MEFKQVISFINNTGLTNTQLAELGQAIVYARAQLGHSIIRQLRVGDSVNFTNTRTGRNMTGVIIKVAIKNLHVSTAEGNWRVPANMVTLVEELA